MYKELATLIDDNDFLTNHQNDENLYLIIAKPDEEYMDELAEERTNSKEAQIIDG